MQHSTVSKRKLPFLSVIAFLFIYSTAQPQGCIAIRNLAGFGQFAQLGYGQTDHKWMMNINYRYFSAYKLYSESNFISATGVKADRITNTNRVMNFSLSRVLDNGWQLSMDLPIASATGTSWQEHPGSFLSKEQHSVNSFGIGDMRLTVYKWIFKSDVPRNGNIQVGLGLKLPTGNYRAQDFYYTEPNDPLKKELGYVNGALQLGDGGTGVTFEVNSYYLFTKAISVYGNLFYLVSPNNTSGVDYRNQPGVSFSPAQIKATYNYNSIPDNYTARGGASFTFNKFVANAGLRFEGAPAHDLVGKNDGLRRVGHVFSIEPGLQYKLKGGFLYAFVTVPLVKATIQTVPDKIYTQLDDPNPPPPGHPHVAGDRYVTPGHFADYLLFFGYAFTF